MLTLIETKLHLRVDHDHEDTLITGLMAAATTTVGNYLDNTTLVLDETAPAPIKSAALLLIGDLFENRSAQVEKPLRSNETFERLLSTYRTLTA